MSGISKKKMYHRIARADYRFPDDEYGGGGASFSSNFSLSSGSGGNSMVVVEDQAKDLVKRILTVNSDRRATLREIMDHPWLQL